MSDIKDAAKKPRLVEEQGATEDKNEKIDAIVGDEVLGYEGSGREEHSGQPAVERQEGLTDALADNRPDQVK